MSPRMAWDPPTAEAAADRGRHGGRMFRSLVDAGQEDWERRDTAGRLRPLRDLVAELTSFFGQPAMQVELADEHEIRELVAAGRSVGIVEGDELPEIYDSAFFEADEIVRRALESRGYSPDRYDLSQAMEALPHKPKLVVDPSALSGGLDRVPIVMGAAVERLAESTNDPRLQRQALDMGTSYANGLAQEVGADYLALAAEPAEAPGPVDRETPQASEEVERAHEAQPQIAADGANVMRSFMGQAQQLTSRVDWNALPVEERLAILHDSIGATGVAVGHSGFDVAMADADEQGMLRGLGRVAEILPEERSLARYGAAFDEAKGSIFRTLEEQGLGRGWMDPAEIVSEEEPRKRMVVDAENLAGDIRDVPTFFQGVAEGVADDLGAPPSQAREVGVAFGSGAAMEAETPAWATADFGTPDTLDISAISDDLGPGRDELGGPDDEGPDGPTGHPVDRGPVGPAPSGPGGAEVDREPELGSASDEPPGGRWAEVEEPGVEQPGKDDPSDDVGELDYDESFEL